MVNSTSWERRVADIAELVAWLTHERPPTIGSSRLLCVDGRAGSGKTTLGRALQRATSELGTSRLIAMDDLYEGWSGLGGELSAQIDSELLGPLREDRPGRYHRYDWEREQFAEWHTVEPVDILVVEGVGSGASAYHQSITTLVWVEAPRELCLKRGIARDGEEVLEKWLVWMDDEDTLFDRERTHERADVVVDGTGGSDRAVVLQ